MTGGYNGGGTNIGSGTNCNGGGGATDIRIGEDSLYNRILVAGGGGSGSAVYAGHYGGSGGGIEGQPSGWGPLANGGKQNEPGTGGYSNQNGNFGYGGNHSGQSGGAGGGWFGSAASSNTAANTGGGGGSGYVFNETSYQPPGFKLTSKYFLRRGDTISGMNDMLSPYNRNIKEKGHHGHGAARISRLDLEDDTFSDYLLIIMNCFMPAVYISS